MSERWTYDKHNGVIHQDGKLIAEVAGAGGPNYRHAKGERNARIIAVAPEMLDFVEIVYKLLTEDDETGEGTMNWHMTCDEARRLLNYIDRKEHSRE